MSGSSEHARRLQGALSKMRQIVDARDRFLLDDDRLLDYFDELYAAVQEVRRLQQHDDISGVPLESDDDDSLQFDRRRSLRKAALSRLVEQFRERGGYLNQQLSVEHVGPGAEDFGLCANGRIAAFETLASIPTDLCVISGSDTVAKGRFAWLMKSHNLPPNIRLVLWLICQVAFDEPTSDACTRAYVDSMPKRIQHCLYSTPKTVRILRGSYLLQKVVTRYRSIVLHYLTLLASINDSRMKRQTRETAKLTFELFRWAVAVVMTRSNPLPVSYRGENGERTAQLAMVPIFDLFNHAAGIDTKQYDAESGRYCVTAMRDADAGDQVFMYYCRLEFGERLTEQGFVAAEELEEPGELVFLQLPFMPESETPRSELFPCLQALEVQEHYLAHSWCALPVFGDSGKPIQMSVDVARFYRLPPEDRHRLFCCFRPQSHDGPIDFPAYFHAITEEHPMLDRDAFILLHKLAADGLAAMKRNERALLEDEEMRRVRGDHSTLASSFFAAMRREHLALENAIQHLKATIRDIIARSVTASKAATTTNNGVESGDEAVAATEITTTPAANIVSSDA